MKKSQRRNHTCKVKYCCKKRVENRTICAMHQSRRLKEINPSAYFFNLLRCNAKRRGKDFNLSLAEFRAFCKETGYLESKGRFAHQMTIDRIDNTKGYSATNIRILSCSLNSIKSNRVQYTEYFNKAFG